MERIQNLICIIKIVLPEWGSCYFRRVGLDGPSHQDGFNGGKNLEAEVLTESWGTGDSLFTPGKADKAKFMLDDH